MLVLGVVLLAATAAQAEDRECIETFRGWWNDNKPMDMTAIKRLCDPKNFVTNPNEYGWVCYDERGRVRVKGEGAKQQRDALCGTE